MKSLLTLALVLGTTGSLVLQAAEQGTQIRVRVYNYAALDRSILVVAQRQTAAVLSGAGVVAEWVGCPVTPAQAGTISGCTMPLGGMDIVLNLLSDAMVRQARQTAETFGFTVGTSPQGFGTANIFVSRAEGLALHGPFSISYEHARATVLGHMIAHEIGHLLLGPGKHSAGGLMAARWSEKEIRQLAKGHLRFSVEEAGAIRSRLERRAEPHLTEKPRNSAASE